MAAVTIVSAGLLSPVAYLLPISNERRHVNCYSFIVVSFFMSFGPSLKRGINSLAYVVFNMGYHS